MRRPSNFDYSVPLAWLEHFGSFWAWEELGSLIQQNLHVAWRRVRVMIAYAPDFGTLAYVAAGPVEDLFGLKELMLKEAEINPRFRICLGMTNGLPAELEPFADRREVENLPPATPIDATAEEFKFVVAYVHNGDTSWAARLLDEKTRHDPDEGLFMLRLLLNASKRTPYLRKDVFLHGFGSFVRLNFGKYQQV